MKNIFFFLLILLLPLFMADAQAQNNTIDSLQTLLKKAKPDTTKVNILNGLSEHAGWRINQNDVCIDYAQEALSLAKKIDFKDGMARSYNNIGNGEAGKLDFQEALNNYFTALELYKATGNKHWEGKVYN